MRHIAKYYISMLTMLIVILIGMICHAEEGLQVKITNGDYTEEITLTEEFYRKSIEIDYTQDITVEVVDKGKEVYFGHIVDNQGSVSDIKSETNILTVTPSEDSVEERIIIRTGDKDYSILYKYDFLLNSLKTISQDGFEYGSRYIITEYGLKTAFNEKGVTLKQGIDKNLDYTTFESEYLGEEDNVVYTGVYLINDDETVDTSTMQTDYIFEIHLRKPALTGGYTPQNLGDNIRVYAISGEEPELIYTQSEIGGYNIRIKTNRLGTYAIVYDEYAFSAKFYYEYTTETEPVLYQEIDNIRRYETEFDIELPQRAGYTFVKWIRRKGAPPNMGALVQGANIVTSWYASWVKDEEYEPLEISLSAPKPIFKGKESGSAIIMTASQGQFSDLESWNCKVIGSDELTISEAYQLDETNVALTLSGNSTSQLGDMEIGISFDSSCLESEVVKIDSSGRQLVTYTTDNTVTIKSILSTADLYYSFDADSVTETDGVYTIKDLSGNGFDAISEELETITEWNEVKPKRNEAVRGSFEIPKEAFAETDSYTMNFWLVNTYSQDYILDFDDVKLSHSWGSGITRICSYFENREVSSAPYKYNIKIEELNMYTIVKDGENIKIYINGVYNEPETINRKSTVKLADIADKKDAQFIVNADYMIDEMSFYNRALSDAEIESLVGGANVTIDDESIDYGTDSITLDVNVSNAMKNNLNLFVALYSYDGELLDTFVYKSTMPIVNEKITCTLKDDWDGDNVKAYLWDSNMKPLCAAAHEW